MRTKETAAAHNNGLLDNKKAPEDGRIMVKKLSKELKSDLLLARWAAASACCPIKSGSLRVAVQSQFGGWIMGLLHRNLEVIDFFRKTTTQSRGFNAFANLSIRIHHLFAAFRMNLYERRLCANSQVDSLSSAIHGHRAVINASVKLFCQ